MSETRDIEEKETVYERADGSRYRRIINYVKCPLCFGDNPSCSLCGGTGQIKTETYENLEVL